MDPRPRPAAARPGRADRRRAVPSGSGGPMMGRWSRCFGVPGAFVSGNNDYYGAAVEEPVAATSPARQRPQHKGAARLGRLRRRAGRHRLAGPDQRPRHDVNVGGRAIDLRGVDDPTPAGTTAVGGRPGRPGAEVRLGPGSLTRTEGAGRLAADGCRSDARRPHPRRSGLPARDRGAGHQLRHRPRPSASGLPGRHPAPESVAARLGRAGTSPYAPVRFACRPEATLLTLIRR